MKQEEIEIRKEDKDKWLELLNEVFPEHSH